MNKHYHVCTECKKRFTCFGKYCNYKVCEDCRDNLEDLDSEEIYIDWSGKLIE